MRFEIKLFCIQRTEHYLPKSFNEYLKVVKEGYGV